MCANVPVGYPAISRRFMGVNSSPFLVLVRMVNGGFSFDWTQGLAGLLIDCRPAIQHVAQSAITDSELQVETMDSIQIWQSCL